MRNIRVLDIKYETDGAKVALPKELEFEVEDDFTDNNDTVADLISEKTEWLVKSFSYYVECGNCERPATHSAAGIDRCDRCN